MFKKFWINLYEIVRNSLENFEKNWKLQKKKIKLQEIKKCFESILMRLWEILWKIKKKSVGNSENFFKVVWNS